jgi:CBS domain-containing protein
MNTSSLASFLASFPPFDELDPEALAAVVEHADVRRYAAGEPILVEDAAPAEHLFVVRSGAVSLVHEGEVIDVLEPGESFGHPSMLTGLSPAFTVRANDDCECVLVPREQALQVLGRPEGAGFVATTLRDRLARTGHTVHALPQLGTIRVSDLMQREPVFCDPGTTISHAARTMTDHNSSAILVRDGERIYTVTDAALRARVVAGEVSAQNPVSRVATPAVTVTPDRLAVDAVVDMLDRGVEHLVVLAPDARTVLGVVSAADLIGLEARSPFALRHTILSANTEDELVEAAGKLRQLFLALLDANLDPVDVGRVLSLQFDSFTTRLLDLAIERHGAAPVAWAWLALGSAARREFTLGSDQENALAYAGADDPDVDRYFERVATDVNAALARCGFVPDPNDVLARTALWRMSETQWVRVFQDCLDAPDRSHLVRANVAFDFRQVAGGLEVTPALVAVLRRAREHPDFLRRLARAATDFKPPLGFRRSFATERDHTFDLKKGGAVPIANLARFYALSNAITISATLDRLVAAEEVGALDAEAAVSLREAFAVVAHTRLEHHAAQVAAGEAPDNMIDPRRLAPLAREQLRGAFAAIAQAQKRLGVYVPLGM